MTKASVGGEERRAGWLRFFAVLPGAAVGFLPVGVCAACWPAYAGVLGTLGLGFVAERRYLLPFTFVALGVALGALAYRARARRGYGPLAVGALGSLLLVLGKFALGWAWLTYGAVALLLAASLWNSWPRRRVGSCPACQVHDRTERT
jgi:hypothetical protein